MGEACATTISPWPRRASRALDWLWSNRLTARPVIDPDLIVAAAAQREGRAPVDGEWRPRLNLLCRSLNEEAELNSLGLNMAYVQLSKLVAARVRAERWREKSPAILDRPIVQPVLIVGQMRSGTTRMHRLLSCDPAFACNRLFEQLDPVPHFGFDRRRLVAHAVGAAFRLFDPQLAAIHPSSAGAVEEDFGLHAFSFWGPLFEGQWRVPSFVRHLETADAAGAYREFADLLRLIGGIRRDDPARTWLLKSPQFSQDIGAVMRQFPDARLIVLHRPPEEVVASAASLVWHEARIQSDHVSREEIGAEWLRKSRLRADRLAARLAAWPNAARVDLHYADVSRDWRAAIRSVYAMLDRPLQPEVKRRMERFVQRSTDHQRHRYALEDFGLTGPMVQRAFA